jgi:chaperonin GroES
MLKFRPLSDWVLVQRLEAEDKIGSLHLPDAAKTKAQRGTIVAIGKGLRTDKGVLVPPDVGVGDEVYFGKYSGEDVRIGDLNVQLNGIPYVIMREREILAVFERKAKRAA